MPAPLAPFPTMPKLGYFIERDGDVDFPMHRKFEIELQELKDKEAMRASARQHLITYREATGTPR